MVLVFPNFGGKLMTQVHSTPCAMRILHSNLGALSSQNKLTIHNH